MRFPARGEDGVRVLGPLSRIGIAGTLLAGGAIVAGAVVATQLVRRELGERHQARLGAELLAREPQQPGTVRVMTFNIKAAHGAESLGDATPAERERNLHEIAAFIERVDPDVVLLQEVENGFERGGPFPMYDRLRELVHADDGVLSAPRIGVAILTRNGFTIRDRVGSAGNQHHNEPVRHSSVLAAPIEAPPERGGGAFTVVNAHIKPGRFEGLADRYLAAIRAGRMDTTRPFPKRIIVGGDLNETTERAHGLLSRATPLTDVFTTQGVALDAYWKRATSAGVVGNAFGDVVDRDQLHVTDGFDGVLGAAIPDPRYAAGPMADEPLSDHRPVVADIRL